MSQSIQMKLPHYYGDTVRWLFMIAAVIMVIMLPMISSLLNVPIILSVIGILILGIAAGFTNPKQLWDAIINTVISVAGFLIFETVAVLTYQQQIRTTSAERFFFVNIGLGLLFLIALYFSVKTLRGIIMKDNIQQTKI